MQICEDFRLKRETFHLSVNYVDRFLAMHPHLHFNELQLIGTAAMFIASKNEEIYSPVCLDFSRATDNGFSTEQIYETERRIMNGLLWRLNPTTMNYWA